MAMSPLTPCSWATRQAATEVVRMAGWQLRVEVRSSAGPSKQRRARSYPRMSFASSKVRRAEGKAAESARPMPTCCAPWPGKSRAISWGPRPGGRAVRAASKPAPLLLEGHGRTKPDNRAMIDTHRPLVQHHSPASGPGSGPRRRGTMAAVPPLIPLRDLFGDPERALARLAPDGRRLSWLAPREGVLNVWVRDRDGGEARPVTDDRDRGVRSYLWSRDSRRIL